MHTWARCLQHQPTEAVQSLSRWTVLKSTYLRYRPWLLPSPMKGSTLLPGFLLMLLNQITFNLMSRIYPVLTYAVLPKSNEEVRFLQFLSCWTEQTGTDENRPLHLTLSHLYWPRAIHEWNIHTSASGCLGLIWKWQHTSWWNTYTGTFGGQKALCKTSNKWTKCSLN